uniref:Uncharacterized protein n=1 Tax=Anguilla anguilla TaxID=7936 RepID=A0A0E9XC84_ANGAN
MKLSVFQRVCAILQCGRFTYCCVSVHGGSIICFKHQFTVKLEHRQHFSIGGILFYCTLTVRDVWY